MREINGQLHLMYNPLALAIRNILLSEMYKDPIWRTKK
jgi:hypothetical protein